MEIKLIRSRGLAQRGLGPCIDSEFDQRNTVSVDSAGQKLVCIINKANMATSKINGRHSGGANSPSNNAQPSKASPLISQLRTTSNGSGGGYPEDQMAASPADHMQSDYSATADQNQTVSAGNGYSSNRVPATSKGAAGSKGNTGLNMSQTRTTTHTSNQHNSGGNVAAPKGVLAQN